jgi:N4-gp56 family major capsid protein
MTIIYNDPAGGSPSSVGSQIRTDYYDKKALIEARKEQYFMQLSSTINLPKHFGKKIKKNSWVPLLDDANVNDQGLDAAGAVITAGTWDAYLANGTRKTDGVGANADGSYATEAAARTAAGAGGSVVQNGGNLYGSSKDIGAINGKLPVLSENGGRVNRVGFTRLELEGTIQKMGFFTEFTQESLDFDTEEDLYGHMSRELLNGAHEITEDKLQIDLINNAGIERYAGDATADAEVDNADVVTYGDLLRLSIDLDNNRTPKHTTIITGTRLTDTRTIPAARIMYVGSELQPTLEAMKDLHNNPAFIPVHKYAAGTEVMQGEIGSISHFRIVVVPEMLKWAGAGADASGTDTHYETGDKYDIFPMLVVGSESFSTIGFQTDGKTVKFKTMVKMPGEATADRNDPYGEKGFSSIKWYYGFLAERPERIALIKTAASM